MREKNSSKYQQTINNKIDYLLILYIKIPKENIKKMKQQQKTNHN